MAAGAKAQLKDMLENAKTFAENIQDAKKRSRINQIDRMRTTVLVTIADSSASLRELFMKTRAVVAFQAKKPLERIARCPRF
jgi:hypothetical protein